MNEKILSNEEIESITKKLLAKYNAEYAVLFGSYARGEADENSDIDLVVFGGELFSLTDIFNFAEEFRESLGKNADVYEISEINEGTELYNSIIKEGVRIA